MLDSRNLIIQYFRDIYHMHLSNQVVNNNKQASHKTKQEAYK